MTTREAISLIKNDHIPAGSLARWADLGCGDGLFTLALASFLPAGSTYMALIKAVR